MLENDKLKAENSTFTREIGVFGEDVSLESLSNNSCEGKAFSIENDKLQIKDTHTKVGGANTTTQLSPCLETPNASTSINAETGLKPGENRTCINNSASNLFPCSRCSRSFSSINARKVHIYRTHNRPRTGPSFKFICGTCGVGFKTEKALSKHKVIHNPNAEDPPKSELVRGPDAKLVYKCRQCSQIFAKHYNFIVHKMSHGINVHACKVCGKQFPKKQGLERHMRMHTGEKPFCCHECGKSFTTKGSLKLHSDSVHREDQLSAKPFRCYECGQGFTQKGSLKAHYDRFHRGDQLSAKLRFLCHVCSKGFYNNYELTSHMRLHTGERPHHCQDCGKGFRTAEHLRWHRNVHTGERRFVCK